MIKNIIFDIGRVLVHFEWQEYLESFHFPAEEYNKLADTIFKGPYWNQYDEGKVSDKEILARFIACAPEYEKDICRVFHEFGSHLKAEPYAYTWVKELKEKGYRIYYLSNYAKTTREASSEALRFIELADGGLMSYEVQMIKPNPAFYQCLFDKYSLTPSESVFIDDNRANIEAANALGLHTILFKDYESACQQLCVYCKD